MSEVVTVHLSTIDANPLRRLDAYPYNEAKIETLRQSIRDVGLWEGVIGRKRGNRVQIAFGHHRIEAARRELGSKASVSLILRDLDDEQMLQFMGRENLEDYNADFLAMLEAWEAAYEFCRRDGGSPEAVNIAEVLGWARRRDGGERVVLKDVADACNNALSLIEANHIKRSQFAGLSVKSVREICQTVVARHRSLDSMAKRTGRPTREVNAAKRVYGKAAAAVAEDVREGRTAQRDIKARVDVTAYGHSRDKARSLLFAVAAEAVVKSIARMLDNDSSGEKLNEFQKSLHLIELDEDLQSVKRIAHECGLLAERSHKWQRCFSNPKKKVVSLKEVTS